MELIMDSVIANSEAYSLKKSRTSRSEILSYLDDCKHETLNEACLIGRVESLSCTSKTLENSGDYHIVLTSTPNPKTKAVRKTSVENKSEKVSTNQKNILNSDQDVVSTSKLLSMAERKRKEDVKAKMKAEILAKEEQKRHREAAYQAQSIVLSKAKACKVQEEQLRWLRAEEANAAELKHRQELEQQKRAQRKSIRDEQIKEAERQKEEAEEERRKRTAELSKFTKEIQSCLSQFFAVYKKICEEFNSNLVLSPLVAEVKPLYTNILSIIERTQTGDVNQNDCDAAKSICAEINTKYACILEEVAKLKQQAVEKASIKEQESKQVPPQMYQSQVVEAVLPEICNESSTVDGLSDCADKASLQWYQELRIIKQRNESLFEQLLKDNNFKKYRFDIQKAVNIPVNAISPVSASHLKDKLHKLTLLLSGQHVVVGDGVRVSAAEHVAGIPFCKDLLAKKFVRQGALTVSSKPEAAFAIAAVIVALWLDFPDWGQLLLAHFHNECPYLVPVFWPQLEGQSNKDYYQSLGYTYNEDGEVEKQDKFLKRMSGIMRLYSAVLITRVPRDKQDRPHPHGLGQGWRWLTSLINLEPRPDICATLLYDFLEVAGSRMLEQYGRQYQKLLLAICKGYFPRLQTIATTSGGPVVRLQTYLQAILKQENKPPQGMLPPHFW